MTVLFAAGEYESFTLSTTNDTDLRTDTGHGVDTDYQRSWMEIVGNEWINMNLSSAASEGWLHFQFRPEFSGSVYDLTFVEFRNSTDILFRVEADNGTLNFETYDGSSFDEKPDGWAFPRDVNMLIDIHWVVSDTTGVLEFYVNNILYFSFEGDTLTNTVTTVDNIRLYCPTSNNATAYSFYIGEVIVADEDTRGWRLVTMEPDGTGGVSEWTGSSTDVDELGFDDTDMLTSSTAGQTERVTTANLAAGVTQTGFAVEAVAVGARARNDGGTGPQNLELVCYAGTTETLSGNVSGIGTTFDGFNHVFSTNPDDAAAWDFADLSGVEVGVESKA